MIKLSDHFSYSKLLRYALPSIIMFVLSSTYGVIDGLFIGNFAGKTAFASVSFALPFLFILDAIGLIFGTGGGALIAKTIGEKKRENANSIFSLLVYTSLVAGVLFTILGYVFLEPFLSFFGAEGALLKGCLTYGNIYLLGITPSTIQLEFQSFFPVAEKPKIGLRITIITGLINILLDALFIVVFKWGLMGAAIATTISKYIAGMIPILYFSRKNSSLLKLTKTHLDIRVLRKACSNGASEFMTNVAVATVGMLYNVQLLKYAGENGIAAYGVIMYVNMVFNAIFLGYAAGTSPIISYHLGARNYPELKNLRRKCMHIILSFSLLMFIFSQVLARPLVESFFAYDQNLIEMTLQGFRIFSFSFIFVGFSIFGSSFFTALNDGFVSATISFSRSFLFQILAVLTLPIILGLNGVWGSIVLAEMMAAMVSLIFIIIKKKKYHY